MLLCFDELIFIAVRFIGGAGSLPARQQFFRHAYSVLNDDANMPEDSDVIIQTEDNS